MKNTLCKKLHKMKKRAENAGVDVGNPLTTIEKTPGGVVVIKGPYGNEYKEAEGLSLDGLNISAPCEEFPKEGFPPIALCRLMPILATADALGRSVKIKRKRGELQLRIGGSYIVSLPLPPL